MVLNNFIKAACLSTCLGLASGSILANTYNVETNGGLNVYDSNDSDHWFNLTGKMQLDHTLSHKKGSVTSQFNLNSVQAKVQGGVGQNLSYSFRLKRNGDSVTMDQSQVNYSGFNSWSKVSVGQVSVPYGLGSSNFTSDSLTNDLFSPSTGKNALGVALTAWNDKVGLSVSVHQPTKEAVKGVNGLDTAARLSYAALNTDNLILHVGMNAYMQQSTKVDNVLLTEKDKVKNRGFGLDTALLRGPLFVKADFHQANWGQKSAMGYNVEASYALTGESRDYNKVTGSFSSLRTERDGGSWEVSARHSGALLGGKSAKLEKRLGANVAWTVNNNITVLANYENNLNAKEGDLSLRLQAAW